MLPRHRALGIDVKEGAITHSDLSMGRPKVNRVSGIRRHGPAQSVTVFAFESSSSTAFSRRSPE
jgi:hypothetical protein